jgi:hypothetical protein
MFHDRPASAAASPQSNYVQPNLGHGLRIWWAFFWRNAIISAILTAILGLTVKFLAFRGLAPASLIRPAVQLGSYVTAYASAFFVIHYVVKKKFRQFHITLLPIGGSEDAEPLPPNMKRTFRIWWTFTWRTFVYGLVLSFVANVPLAFLNGLVAVVYPPLAAIFTQLVSLAIGGAVGLFVIYASILDEEFGSFRVALASNAALPSVRAVLADTPATDVPSPSGSPDPIV